jgi:uncharacterized membrane protein YkvA (DUF1232 family)
MTAWQILLGVGATLVICWLALFGFLVATRPRGSLLREAVRLLPDVLRLLGRLAVDRSLPRSVRVRLWLVLVYLGSPIDIIPDFIPVIGQADDAILVAVLLRSVVRRAGAATVASHWPGTPDGLAALWRAARLPDSPPT